MLDQSSDHEYEHDLPQNRIADAEFEGIATSRHSTRRTVVEDHNGPCDIGELPAPHTRQRRHPEVD